MMLGVASLPHNGDVDDGKPHRHLMTSFSQSSDPVRPLNRLNPVCDDFELRLDASSSCSFSVPFGKSALRLPLHAACSAAPVSIRRPRSRVPRLGTRLGGLRLAVLRCVRPHCRAGVVPVPFRQRGKIAQVVLAMTWFTDNYITRYGMTQSYQAEADLRCAGTTRK